MISNRSVRSISLLALASSYLTVSVCAQTAVSGRPVVTTRQGRVSGVVQSDGSTVFQAIPYAAPPVGNLRWKSPAPPAKYDGLRDGSQSGNTCMQIDQHWNTEEAKLSSEDCLYLNVATPSLKPAHAAPVIVWIHGGGNSAGSGRSFVHTSLTRYGVVLVSLNYRLAIFGFLSHPQLTAESPSHSSGNYAVQDQIAALKWVQANIAAFGGDPANITVAGQSAGAMDIGALLLSPEAKGLFKGAIMESGGPIAPTPELPTLAESEATGVSLGSALGAPAGPNQLADMRKIPATELMMHAAEVTRPDGNGVPTRPGPVMIVDGYILREQPLVMVRAGRILKVPMLIGNNIQEFTFGPPGPPRPGVVAEPADRVRETIQRMYGAQADAAMAVYGMNRSDAPAPDPQYGTVGTQLMTDVSFRCPAYVTDEWLAARGDVVYSYQFERPLPGTPGAGTAHSGELPYVFGWAEYTNVASPGVFSMKFGPEDATLSQQMQEYWTSFARTGHPEVAGLPLWPRFTDAKPEVMRFTTAGPKVDALPHAASCSVFKAHLEDLIKE